MPLIFVDGDGFKNEIQAQIGEDLLSLAHHNDIDMEGACEGSLACSTCHVILEEDIYDELEGDYSAQLFSGTTVSHLFAPLSIRTIISETEPCEDEEDMLDLAPGLTMTSRLGCQVCVTKAMSGAEIRLPTSTVNFYVDGHKPKYVFAMAAQYHFTVY